MRENDNPSKCSVLKGENFFKGFLYNVIISIITILITVYMLIIYYLVFTWILQ